MLATTCSRLAVKPSTCAGMVGARQLSCSKLAPTQAGVGRESTTSSDLHIRPNGLSAGGNVDLAATTGPGPDVGFGAAFATTRVPAAATATARTTPVPIHFSIFPSLRIDAAGADRALLDQVAELDHPLIGELLHPLTAIGLGGVDVALGVGDDAVDGIELARLTTAAAEPV